MKKYLINTTRVGTTVQCAGSAYDTVSDEAMISAIVSAGGRLVDPTPELEAIAAVALQRHARGDETASIDAMMSVFAEVIPAANVPYDDSVPPTIGAADVQQAIDYLKAHVGDQHRTVAIFTC